MKKNANMEMLKILGVDLNPMNQLGSLVNLLNASQELPMRQEQFDREMNLRQDQMAFEQDFSNRKLNMAQQEETRRNEQMKNYNLLQLLQLGMGAKSDLTNPLRGQVNDQVLNDILAQLGFGAMLSGGNPQQPVKKLRDLDTPEMDQAFRNLQMTQ